MLKAQFLVMIGNISQSNGVKLMTDKYINVIEKDSSGGSCDVTSSLQPLPGGVNPNLLINGDFIVAQRGTSFDATTTPKNDDDTYLLDRWVLLSDGNNVVDVEQIETAADLPTGGRAAIKYTWETANKQAGLLQIIEGVNARPAIGGPASLSFQAKANGLANLRAAVLSWGSTEDAVTRDVVTTWNGAGTNPTFATNWTAENTPSDLALSSSWETYTIENIDVDTASTTNIAVFVWLDDADAAVNDTLLLTDVKLEVGDMATNFVSRSYTEETMLCYRYFWSVNGGGNLAPFAGVFNGTSVFYAAFVFPAEMNTPLSLSFGGNGLGIPGVFVQGGSVSFAPTSASANFGAWGGRLILNIGGGGGTDGQSGVVEISGSDDSIQFSGEL